MYKFNLVKFNQITNGAMLTLLLSRLLSTLLRITHFTRTSHYFYQDCCPLSGSHISHEPHITFIKTAVHSLQYHTFHTNLTLLLSRLLSTLLSITDFTRASHFFMVNYNMLPVIFSRSLVLLISCTLCGLVA